MRDTTTTRRLAKSALAFLAAAAALAPGTAAADPPALYVTNYNDGNGTGDVPGFTASGAPATGYATPTGFSAPEGVAVDAANNTLYVADVTGSGSIRTFNATTGKETSLGFAGVSGLNGPQGLLLAGGDLLVANEDGNNLLAFDPADATVDARFTSPAGLSFPIALAELGSTLFVSNHGSAVVSAFNVSNPSAPVPLFTIGGFSEPYGMAVYGHDLFVADLAAKTVGEYDALTGAVINAHFLTGLEGPYSVAVLGSRLLVTDDGGTDVAAYGIPATATFGNVPTSTDATFLTGLNDSDFIAVLVPEPSTWTLLGAGLAAGGVWMMRRRARRA